MGSITSAATEDRYGILASAQQRYRNKLCGAANAHLAMWPHPDGAVRWWLTATAGDGPVRKCEQLRDANRKRERITVTGYELVRTPCKGKGKGRPLRWTWRMTPENLGDPERPTSRSHQAKQRSGDPSGAALASSCTRLSRKPPAGLCTARLCKEAVGPPSKRSLAARSCVRRVARPAPAPDRDRSVRFGQWPDSGPSTKKQIHRRARESTSRMKSPRLHSHACCSSE